MWMLRIIQGKERMGQSVFCVWNVLGIVRWMRCRNMTIFKRIDYLQKVFGILQMGEAVSAFITAEK